MLQREKDPISRSEKAHAGCYQLGCGEAKFIHPVHRTNVSWLVNKLEVK